jgi:geranylgeranyl pyrophosphate synthase
LITIAEENDLHMRTRSGLVSCTRDDFHAYTLGTKRSIEFELEELLSKIPDVKLRPLLEFALLSKGKRLRPMLTLLSAQSVGGDPKKVMQLALSFELLHTATLVHDDIIDQDATRRGLKPLYLKWSLKDAILAGDAFIALSVNLASDFGSKIMKSLAEIGLELSDGEYFDAVLSLDRATEQQYFTKIEKKSASLFRGAAFCGALAAGGTPIEAKALAKFGEYFGMAYQLNDDLDDLLGQNRISPDLSNGNVTLPILYMYEHGNDATKKLMVKCFGNRNITLADMDELKDRMEKIGAFRYCKRKIAECVVKSRSSLKAVRDSEFKNYLDRFYDCVDEFEGKRR